MSFDVETSGRANKFYMCGVIDTQGVYKAYYDKKEFLEYLLKLNLKNTLVFATNLNFDYSSISEGTNLNNRCSFVINAGHFIMVEVNGSYQYIKLLDSMNYGGLSVEKMGKILGLPKGKKPKALGKIPKNKRDKKELEDYNRRDCEITRNFMILIQDTLNLIGGELKLTISSCAMDLFRRKFLKFELMRENISLGFDVKKNIFEAYFGGRVEAVGRGKIEDYNYFDVNCFSIDTEIMTDKGFKSYYELNIEDKIFGMNKKGSLSKQKINKIIVHNYKGIMYNLENENTSQLITPNHRILYKEYNRNKLSKYYKNWSDWKVEEVKNLKSFNHIKFPNSKIYNGSYKIDENILRLCAWYITEGHINKNGMIEISQSLTFNKEKCLIIKKLLEDCKIKYREIIRIQKGKNYLYVYFRKEYIEKYFNNILSLNSYNMRLINNFIELTFEQKLIFFKELMLGDGCYQKGKTSYVSYSDKLLNDFQILTSMIGYKCLINYKNHVALIKINRGEDSYFNTSKIKKQNYNNIVWCVNTPLDNVVMRRKGKLFISKNSLYPSVMLKDYPNPNSCEFIDENDYQIDYLNYEGVSYFELNIPYSQYPVLPYRMKNKLCFPYGKIKGFYTHYEIRYARDYYKKYKLDFKILKMNQTLYYTEMIPIFKEYVEDLYTQRNHYKSLGSPYEVCFKLLLNTLYGKWGYRYVARTKFFINLSDKEMCKIIDEYEENEIYVNDIGEGYAQSVTDFDGVYSFPIFAVYTTSYARVKLHTLIDETNPIYYDTDSIITKSFMKDSRELGDLKLEKSINTGVIIKPKMYFLDEDLKMKGVPIPKNIRDKIRLKRKILNKDFIHYQKFTKIKEGIRSNRKVNSIYVMQKYVSLNDDKRNWEGREFNPLEFQLSKPVKINCDEIEVKEK
jgi:hypothetical protein